MAVSPYTFRGAIDLLHPDRRTRSVLDKLFGTALFAGAGVAAATGGPVAGLTAAAWLALADPKNEAVNLLTPVVTEVTQRLRGSKEAGQLELIAAAHTVTVLSSFFDSLPAILGKPFRRLELTDAERDRLIAEAPAEPDGLLDVVVPLPSPRLGLDENIDQNIRPYYERLVARCIDFFTGLDAWDRVNAPSGLESAIVNHSVGFYRSRMLELAPSEPFALWLTLNEIAATRNEVRGQATAFEELRELLAVAAAGSALGPGTYREQLALAAEEVLDEPLLRSRLQTVASPTVRDGFVEPAFHHAIATKDSRPTDEDWWSEQPEYSSLVEFLAGYLASPESSRLPLLLLGHPGAGKSLLTEVLAARLPVQSFAVVRITLRSVNPDDDLATQITKELQRTLQRPNADLDVLRRECGPCDECRLAGRVCPHQCHLVVLLDGFDELVQATGVAQSAYLTKIEAFQKRERTMDRPTSVVVTSRTVVADQAEIPHGTPMIKLREFDDTRIQHWLTAWNAVHADAPDFAPIALEELTASKDIAELARQPLLLLMLAVYLAELGTNSLGAADLTQSGLYERILDRFIIRQITEKSAQSTDDQLLLRRQQRRRLQYAAFGMFNRGRQHLTDAELNADLSALEPPVVATPGIQSLSPADRVLGDFMFVHNARADREQRSAYEFLHATFGEFLVAELVIELLVQLMRHRKLEAGLPHAGGLDDELLRRLLSHQPLSTRQPILIFAAELAERLTDDDRDSFQATISHLLHRELTRPDAGDQLYLPLPYDPVRRRASYTANLTMLRVLLADEPVPIETVVGPDHVDRWTRMVRLWRAGLDLSSWTTVMGVIAVEAVDDLINLSVAHLTPRLDTGLDPALNEAELLGDLRHKAELMIGSVDSRSGDDLWRHTDVAAMQQVAIIDFLGTAIPQFDRLLPLDDVWFDELLATVSSAPAVNSNVRRAILILLSRTAPRLPFDYVQELLTAVLPAPSPGWEVELAAVVGCHPGLLTALPELRDYLYAADPARSTTVVAVLWRAEAHATGNDRSELEVLRLEIDRYVAQSMPITCDHYFAADFITYLRAQEPTHWLSQHDVPQMFRDLQGEYLERIAPEDVLYVAETWPDSSGDFVQKYLLSRAVLVQPGEDLTGALRELSNR
ncbi:NACHT domain-containing protein [Kribbella sindirgiensis]|uniref:NACHT N-terminal Helical domain-containing protein n=1 Tax=Kribbella sindirgiensis TaxID=1124744 RepID=A0A4R0I1Y6_9ACTN|nr:hypothetical protein [Kribbella sindirgiensis]TCC19886.1 hypothetical protein E0H50_37250 [Kribbella sindirgiensis]